MIQDWKISLLDTPALSVDNVLKFVFFQVISKSGLVEKTTFRRHCELELMDDSNINI